MKHLTGIIFCSITLVATVAACWALFPVAAMSEQELVATRTPMEAELYENVTLPNFGETSVFDMVLHYIDNPPAESESQETEVRFQGC